MDMIRGCCAALALVLACGPGSADAVGMFYKGSEIKALGELARIAYAAGAYDSMVMVLSAANPPLFRSIDRCTERWTAGQLEAVFSKYLKDHPEKWDHAAADLLFDSMKDACAKRGIKFPQ